MLLGSPREGRIIDVLIRYQSHSGRDNVLRGHIMTMNRRTMAKLIPAGLGVLLSSGSFRAISGQESGNARGLRMDLRSKPVQRLVVMGESNAYGMSAGDPTNEWVQSLANLIRRFQDSPLRVFNNAIPANVISPAAPGYDPKDVYSTAPSAIERYENDMISYRPDLAVYAYGLNDSRCGHPLNSFMQAYREIVVNTIKKLPDALTVLVGPYWNVQYNAQTWADPKYTKIRAAFGDFNLPGDALVTSYNKAIAKMASETGALFVDVYSLLEGAMWLLTADTCHFNDVGQSLIGMKAFLEIAARCSFLSLKSKRMEEELNLSIGNTGGTQALPHVIDSWRKVDRWKK